jgi:hypothetical protein
MWGLGFRSCQQGNVWTPSCVLVAGGGMLYLLCRRSRIAKFTRSVNVLDKCHGCIVTKAVLAMSDRKQTFDF